MKVVNMHEAKTHLSRLVLQAVAGEPFVIAKAGQPLVMVTAVEPTQSPTTQRVGFLAGEIEIPEDFDTMGEAQIVASFHGG